MVNAPRHALRVFLAQRAKSQIWLALEMHVSQALLSSVLNGWRRPSPEFIRRFRRVTRIDLAQYPLTANGYLSGRGPTVARSTADPHPLPPEPEATRAT
jgi:hypothetical protein